MLLLNEKTFRGMSPKVPIYTVELPPAYARWAKLASGKIAEAMISEPCIIVFKEAEDQRLFRGWLLLGTGKPRFQKKRLKNGTWAFCFADFPEAVAALEKMPGAFSASYSKNLLEDLLNKGEVKVSKIEQVERITKTYYQSAFFNKNNKTLTIVKDGESFLVRVGK